MKRSGIREARCVARCVDVGDLYEYEHEHEADDWRFSMAPPCIDMGQEQTCSGVWDLQFEYPVSRNSVLRVTGQNGT